MAGSNQAVNLTGMMGDMGASLRKGITVDGKMAGDVFAQGLLNSTAPDVDINDPQSLEAMAKWLQRQGKVEEAQRYLMQADRTRKEKGALGRMDKAGMLTQQATAAAMQGDPNNVNRQLASMNALAGQAETVQERAMLDRNIAQVRGTLGPAQQQQVANQANAIHQINTTLERPDVAPEAKEALESRREQMLADPKVAEAYQNKVLSDLQTQQQQAALVEQQTTQRVTQEFDARYGSSAYEEWKEQQVNAGAGRTVADLEQKRNNQEADAMRVESLRGEARAAKEPMDVEFAYNLAERIDGANLAPAAIQPLKDRIAQLTVEMEAFNEKSPEQKMASKNVRARIAKELAGYSALINNASYNKASGETTQYNMVSRELEGVRTQIAKLAPNDTFVRSRASSFAGDKDDIYDGADSDTLKALGFPPEAEMTYYEAVYQHEMNRRTSKLQSRANELQTQLDTLGDGGIDAMVQQFLEENK